MRPETEHDRMPFAVGPQATETVNCPSCHAGLVPGMRFCRACGYRLGEGVAEYVETVRLDGMPTAAAGRRAAQTFGMGAAAQTSGLSASDARMSRRARRARCGGGAGWLTWLVIAFVILGTSGGAAIIKNVRRNAARAHITLPTIPLMSRSFIGVDGFEYVRGEGLLVDAVLPATPAERAGLRDGDLIRRFDGHTIDSREDMNSALRRTPIGKTVEVAYVRDGVAGTTRLTTISPDDFDERAAMPAAGTGYWGVDNLDRVAVEGTNIYGVRLGSVSANRPADIAGLKRGDIVTEFGGNPVRTSAGLASYIHHAAPGSTVTVAVIRDGERIELPVKMGKSD